MYLKYMLTKLDSIKLFIYIYIYIYNNILIIIHQYFVFLGWRLLANSFESPRTWYSLGNLVLARVRTPSTWASTRKHLESCSMDLGTQVYFPVQEKLKYQALSYLRKVMHHRYKPPLWIIKRFFFFFFAQFRIIIISKINSAFPFVPYLHLHMTTPNDQTSDWWLKRRKPIDSGAIHYVKRYKPKKKTNIQKINKKLI